MKVLNLGCGKEIRDYAVNLDKNDFKGVDVVHDINVYPYPFESNHFDEVICEGIIGYAKDLDKFLHEIARILKPNGILSGWEAYFNTSCNSLNYNTVSYESFNTFFTEYYCGCDFRVVELELIPTRLGKLIPRFPVPKSMFPAVVDLRHLVSLMIGHVINRIRFKLKILK